jgi:hypothetical protein
MSTRPHASIQLEKYIHENGLERHFNMKSVQTADQPTSEHMLRHLQRDPEFIVRIEKLNESRRSVAKKSKTLSGGRRSLRSSGRRRTSKQHK